MDDIFLETKATAKINGTKPQRNQDKATIIGLPDPLRFVEGYQPPFPAL